jgi:hypothetical protein
MYETRYKEEATEFFEEGSALNIDAAIFDLKKRIRQGYVHWMVSENIPSFKLQMSEFRSFLEEYRTQHVPDQSTLR